MPLMVMRAASRSPKHGLSAGRAKIRHEGPFYKFLNACSVSADAIVARPAKRDAAASRIVSTPPDGGSSRLFQRPLESHVAHAMQLNQIRAALHAEGRSRHDDDAIADV